VSVSRSLQVRIATRSSRLALWQAEHVSSLITGYDPTIAVELVPVSTEGDRNKSESLSSFGGVGVFTREIQQAVLDSRADIAVHSLKDLPTQPVAGLKLAGVPARGDRFDALILPAAARAGDLDTLRGGAKIGTGSPRRQAQLRHIRPDLELIEIRGNVETRLNKLDAGEFDAIVLARAGLQRLELSERCTAMLAPPQVYPAVGQAALGLECREGDSIVAKLLNAISDPITLAEVSAERACLSELRAGCHAPVGTWSVAEAERDTARLRLMGVVLSIDGATRIQAEVAGIVSLISFGKVESSAAAVGRALAERLIEAGAGGLLAR
jgi:hydroxymethylbilane synthase